MFAISHDVAHMWHPEPLDSLTVLDISRKRHKSMDSLGKQSRTLNFSTAKRIIFPI
jgi:hypothetical protein